MASETKRENYTTLCSIATFLFHFAFLSTCSPFSILCYFLLLIITPLCFIFLYFSILIHFLLPFPSPFQSCSFTQASSFSSHCRVTDGNLRMKFPPREGAESQGSHSLLKRSCSDARFPVSSPLKLPRQFYEWGGRKVAMTTEGLIVSGAFCWWASYRPQSGN